MAPLSLPACALYPFLWAVLTLPVLSSTLRAQDLTRLTIEELLEVEVISTTRREQPLLDAAAAVFVINREDIRRSGATTIPEVLRLAPGLQVARLDTRHWAVTARGFPGRFANKLLVLVDGRSLYTPTFAGVYWEALDLPLENIDRIEVIRGPGATLWGANAVNGVINIITRPAREVAGTTVTALAGDQEQGILLRQGGSPFDGAWLYGYGQFRRHDGLADATGRPAPAHSAQAGLRLDWSLGADDDLLLEGALGQGSADHHVRRPVSSPPFSRALVDEGDYSSGHLLARWQHRFSLASQTTLQFYYQDEEHRDLVLNEDRHTLELDFQHWLALDEGQQLVWGLAYRHSWDWFEATPLLTMTPEKRVDRLVSFFLQDEIRLDHQLTLTLGSKLEHNDYSGWEVQPSARLLWSPAPRHRLWGAVSRAVRTPARVDHDVNLWLATTPPGTGLNPTGLPLRQVLVGGEDFRPERLLAWEIGYRTWPREDLSLDLTAFLHRYDHLYTAEQGQGEALVVDGEPQLRVPFHYDNRMEGEGRGLELAADWQPSPRWHWQLAYGYLDMDLRADPDSRNPGQELYAGGVPRHQLSLRARWDPTPRTEVDAWLRYTDRLPTLLTPDGVLTVPEHWGLDLRLAWHPDPGLELSLVGQNLLDGEHLEFVQEFHPAPTEVERSFYGQVKWEF